MTLAVNLNTSQRAAASLARELNRVAPGSVSLDVPLSRVSRWRIGGMARAIVDPRSTDEVASIMKVMATRNEPVAVIGETSNILFDSAGFDGVLVRIGRRMSRFNIAGEHVWSEAGTSVPVLSRAVTRRGLTGIEHTIGIPGTLGGLVLMNGGSQRKGIGLSIETVTTVDRNGAVADLTQEQCGFDYRTSALQTNGLIVVEATLRLEREDPGTVLARARRIMLDRLGKFPSNQPNCGSTFLSHPQMYASVGPPGRVIEAAGMKGIRRGGAIISPRHANFIVNTGHATSDDVLWLISLMRTAVEADTGYAMECEARFLSANGMMAPAHHAALERWGRTFASGTCTDRD